MASRTEPPVPRQPRQPGSQPQSPDDVAEQIFRKLTAQANADVNKNGGGNKDILEKIRLGIEAIAKTGGSGQLVKSLEKELAETARVFESFAAAVRASGVQSKSKPDEPAIKPVADLTPIPLAPDNPEPRPRATVVSEPHKVSDPKPAPIPLAPDNPPPQPPPVQTYPIAPAAPQLLTDPIKSGFGMKSPDTPAQSNVSAYDRPQSVIIMGPRPLPVSIVGKTEKNGEGGPSGDGGGGNGGGLSTAMKGIQALTAGLSAMSHGLTAAATTTTAIIDVLGAYTGAIGKLNQMVEKFDPGTAYMFTDAVSNLEAALGKLLVPAIKQATAVVNYINIALSRLGGDSKTMISAFAGAGAIMIALGVALAAVVAGLMALAAVLTIVDTVVSIATGGLSAVFGMIGAGLAAIVVSGTAAGAGMMAFASLTADTSKLLAALGPIMTAFVNSLSRMAPRFLEIAERIAPIVVMMVEWGAQLLEMVVAIASVKGALETLAVAFALAAVPILIMLAPLILLAGAAVAATIAIYTLLRALGLISTVKLGEGTKTIAATQATFGSAQSMAEKTYASAYSLGSGSEEDPSVAAMTGLTTGVTGLSKWIESLVKEVQDVIEVIKFARDHPGAAASAALGVPSLSFRDFVDPLDISGRLGITPRR